MRVAAPEIIQGNSFVLVSSHLGGEGLCDFVEFSRVMRASCVGIFRSNRLLLFGLGFHLV